MIVRTHDWSLELVTQPDHARLAGRIMAHAATLAAHPRREAILLATGEHDNGWTEEDASPDVDPSTGAVIDFVSAPAAVRQGVWPRAVERLRHDPWAAALVAQHAIAVYDRFRPDPEWSRFFPEMSRLRDELVTASGLELDLLLEDYRYVRLGDLLSLMFCTGWTGEQRFDRWRVTRNGSTVAVAPDPFGGLEVGIEVPAARLSRRTFDSRADLHEALRSAAPVTLRGTIIGAAS